jgi:protein-L-isoaspartate(D-aspartate) O-methyltransferase
MPDFAARRTMMVDTQIRPSDVTKYPIIDAMLSVPREDFVPAAQREAAYVGDNMDLGDGRVVLDPRTLAKTFDALDIAADDLVLLIGANHGYAAAVLARLAQAVVALEDDSAMAREAQDALSDAGADNVIVEEGALSGGAAEHGPYDVIVIEGGVAQVPETIAAQLKDGGRLAALFVEGTLGEVRLGYKHDGKITWRRAFNAFAPVLAGFEQEAQFTL